MDLTKYDFGKISDVDIAFCGVNTDPRLLAEAKRRGFYMGSTAYNKLFNKVFFSGAEVAFKDGLDDEFRTGAVRYLRALMCSFQPKHEDKEAVCALLLSELVEAQ